MAAPDLETRIKELDQTVRSLEQVLDLDTMRAEIAELQEQASAPDLWGDQANAQRVTGRLSVLQADIDRITSVRQRLDDVGVLLELAGEEGDATSAAETRAEAEAEVTKLAKVIDALEVRTLLSGEYDAREALVTIRSGAGGVDAADFAEMLQRMYLRWAERHGTRPRSTTCRTPRRPASSRRRSR